MKSPLIRRGAKIRHRLLQDPADGLNAAKLYGIDPAARRRDLPADALDRLKTAYLEQGGQRENAAYGWVRAGD
jgi:hypothetical protein